jgi:hypothetical protein
MLNQLFKRPRVSLTFEVTIMYIEAMYIKALSAIPLICGLVALPGRSADDSPITENDLKQAVGNIRRIAKAFHAHADEFVEHLPVNIVDKDDKPLLSWRVALLPFIEQQDLYKEFKLDEPWDSEHNKKLIERMPKIYAPIHVKAMTGETFYQVFTGKDALFGPGKNPRLSRDIPDGTSITGMVFEAGDPVIWTKPADLLFDEKKPLPKLGGLFDGKCHVALCDSSVWLLKKDPDEKEMKKFIMSAGGDGVDADKIRLGEER